MYERSVSWVPRPPVPKTPVRKSLAKQRRQELPPRQRTPKPFHEGVGRPAGPVVGTPRRTTSTEDKGGGSVAKGRFGDTDSAFLGHLAFRIRLRAAGLPTTGAIPLWRRRRLIGTVSAMFRTLTAALWLSLATSAVAAQDPVRAEIVFLDVGQGDAVAVPSPEAEAALIGAGASSIVPFLRGPSVDAIALAIAAHSRADHIGGMEVVPRSSLATGSL